VRRKMLIAAAVAAIVVAVVVWLLSSLDSIDSYISRAEELRETGEIEKAADLFWQAALMKPDSERAAEALYEAGYTYYVIGEPRLTDERKRAEMAMAARQAFLRLIERYPRSPYVLQSRLELGKIYTELGEFEKALEQYKQVVGMIDDPEKRQEVCLRMAECYERLGQIEMAIARLTDIFNLGPRGNTYETARIVLARYYESAGLYARAVTQLEQLLSGKVSFPTRQEANARLASNLLELNRFQAAIAALDRIEVDSSNRDKINDLRERILRRSSPGGGTRPRR